MFLYKSCDGSFKCRILNWIKIGNVSLSLIPFCTKQFTLSTRLGLPDYVHGTEVSSLISCDAVLVRSSWILAEFGRILTKNCSKIEVPRGTGILLRFKTASQLINELISVHVYTVHRNRCVTRDVLVKLIVARSQTLHATVCSGLTYRRLRTGFVGK